MRTSLREARQRVRELDARRVAHVADVTSVLDPADGRTRIYHVTGELFFASTNELLHLFDYAEDIDRALIDLTDAHIWDTSAVAALDAVVAKSLSHGIEPEVMGLNPHSAELHQRTSGHMVSLPLTRPRPTAASATPTPLASDESARSSTMGSASG